MIKASNEAQSRQRKINLNAKIFTVEVIYNIQCPKPAHIRSDNGSEFVSKLFQTWLKRIGIKPIHIYPGSPRENGYNERFNGTLRNGILNANWFQTPQQAQTSINQWIKEYNHIRPHQALNMRAPIPEITTLKMAYKTGV